MVQINIVYQGGLHCEAVHEPSGAKITTDAPKDNQGKGESFSPTDLVATALGACMLTVMGIAARNWNVNIDGARVSVEKEMSPPPRRIAKLVVVIDMPAGIPEETKQKLEHAAHTCPVHKSLHLDVDMPIKFRWA